MGQAVLILFTSLLLSCSSSQPATSGNVSLGLPEALKEVTAGSLEAHLVATNGEESQQATLTISGGTVSGSLLLKPGTWMIEIQFFEVAPSGKLLSIAFIDFGSKEMGQGGLELSYIPTDIRFSESNGISASLSPTVTPPSGCVSRFDCDGDGVSNFDEMKGGSDPEDPKSLPVTPSVSVPPSASPTITVSINDKTIGEETTMVQGIVKISATATSLFSKSVTFNSVVIKGPGLENGSFLSDGNGAPEIFDTSWDTKAVDGGEDQEYTLTFTAQDAEKRVETLIRKVKIDNVPNIVSFGTPRLIQSSQPVDLSWNANNFTSLSIDNGVGDVTNATKTSVSPTTTTTYRLTAVRKGTVKTFTSTQDVTITVNHNPVFNSHTTSALGQDPKGANGVTLSFDRSDVDGDTLTSTVTVYKGTACGGSSVATQTTTTGAANVTGLDPRTDYSYNVSISDGRGGSATGSCQSFTTADTGLVGWWRFDEGSGTTTKDSSGNGNNGTLAGADLDPAWTTNGIRDGALDFRGLGLGLQPETVKNDTVEIADNANLETLLDCTHAVSFSWWENQRGGEVGGNGYQGILSKSHPSSGSDDGSQQANVYWYNNGTYNALALGCHSGYGGPGPQFVVYSKGVTNDRSWHHYTVTYNGNRSCNAVAMYRDGIRLAQDCADESLFDEPDPASLTVNNDPVRIGAGPDYNDGVNTKRFDGLLDEVSLYNRALSTQEIRDNCQRNDPTGSTCAADDIPEQVMGSNPPEGSIPVTRAYLAWRPGQTPSGKTFDHYELCYTTVGADLTTSCLASSSSDVIRQDTGSTPHFVFETLVSGSAGYSWRVQTCYTDHSCSDFSPVWSFSTNSPPVAWWKFDDSNDPGKDSSGGGHNGTLNKGSDGDGLDLRTGILGQAINFDGNDYINAGRVLGEATDTSFTMMAWVNKLPGGENSETVIGTEGSLAQISMSDWGTPANNPTGQTYFGKNEGGGWFVGGGRIPQNSWHQIVGVYNGTQGTIYVDGIMVASTQRDFTVSHGNTLIGTFRGSPGGLGEYMTGLIDDAAIFSYPLSAAAVTNSYCAVEALAEANPMPAVCQ